MSLPTPPFNPLKEKKMEYHEWSKNLIEILKKYPFLKWQNRKTDRLSKRLFKEGHTPESAAGLIMLNS